MRPVSASIIQWSAFGVGVLLAGLFWDVDVRAFLWPPGADKIIWFPIVVLWIEIGSIVGTLIRRHLAGRPTRGRSPIALAWGAALVNFTFMWILAPGLIFAP